MKNIQIPTLAKKLLLYSVFFSDQRLTAGVVCRTHQPHHPKQDECGEWVTALCPYGEEGCPDNEGDYDIVMPEPMKGTSGSGYKVRVMDIDDEEDADCSDEFTLMGSDEAPEVGDADGPSLEVTSPVEGDVAEACHEYTVEVRTKSIMVTSLSIGEDLSRDTWIASFQFS